MTISNKIRTIKRRFLNVNKKKVAGIVILCFLLREMMIIRIYSIPLPMSVNIENYQPYEPEITEDFPTTNDKIPRIPHIIHQTYISELIPMHYKDMVESFHTLNPKWDFYLWTDDSSRKLVAEKYAFLLNVWDSYPLNIHRADAIRYIVLYEYGGIYADLDMKCLKPLDALTKKYACIFPTEPFEFISIHSDLPYQINNAFMLCRKGHPFLKQLIDSLPAYRMIPRIIERTGPLFVTSQFVLYNKIFAYYGPSNKKNNSESNSPYFYKGDLPETHENAVYVPNSKYFFYAINDNNNRLFWMHYKCYSKFLELGYNQQRGCIELKKRGSRLGPNRYAYVEHLWYQVYKNVWKGLFNTLDQQFNISREFKNTITY